MAAERVTLLRSVREYFSELGKRGGRVSGRGLTCEQARIMIDIREAKREAKKMGKPEPKIDRKKLQRLKKPL